MGMLVQDREVNSFKHMAPKNIKGTYCYLLYRLILYINIYIYIYIYIYIIFVYRVDTHITINTYIINI